METKPDFYFVKKIGQNWSSRIDGCLQEFEPEAPGNVPMNKARAIEVAKIFAVRLEYDLAAIGEPSEIE